MNWKIITWYIGVSLLLVAALMTISGIIALCTPGDESRLPLLLSAFLTGLLGGYPLIFVRKGQHRLNFREGNSIVVGAWLLACLFGSLPYLFYGGEFTPINAMFESVSGFTTTGASILNNIEALPQGLQFWRISTAWVGGVGIVTLFSMLTVRSDKSMLAGAEISTVARDSVAEERSVSFANRMLFTYVVLTLVSFFALRLTGLSWFDSITNAMSACSTCGFCTKNTSIAFYANPAAEIVLTFTMLAAGINFGILFLALFTGKPRHFWKSETVKVFITLVGIAIVIVTADLMIGGGYGSFGTALRDASFQVASISTTTGFATQDTTLWPQLSMATLIICSLICGCSGSTSGGIKIDRAILAAKGIRRKIALTISPNSVQTVRVNGRVRSEEQLSDAFSYIFCYLFIMVFFAAVNIAFGLDFITGVTASIANIGNVGPGFGDVGSMANYAAFPPVLKLTGLAEMLIGRLEIFPILYLFQSVRHSERSRLQRISA
ncbi:MAG: TrkH family potassium uptake protein [Bacteroidales bacterium]|nr:TrkH family potassium uptake protein [Bacteroidales bacterium]